MKFASKLMAVSALCGAFAGTAAAQQSQNLPPGHPALTLEQIKAAERITEIRSDLTARDFSSCAAHYLSGLVFKHEQLLAELPQLAATYKKKAMAQFKEKNKNRTLSDKEIADTEVFIDRDVQSNINETQKNFYGQALIYLVACDMGVPPVGYLEPAKAAAVPPTSPPHVR